MMKAPCRTTCDIISNLPDDVIDVILMCLPLRDTGRTIPKLTLDQILWEDLSTRKVRAKLGVILLHLFHFVKDQLISVEFSIF
ncbi:hypothetical protein H5410_007616 [Solanum commersonii]|uniref:Uncharacterized protein n=1 Tax=Solanum commersonii TaxID=4109 RepID=A0A9J6ACI4_SOLCO|nr:hypothetical protein H5410_007616 [Solanum commersonii]